MGGYITQNPLAAGEITGSGTTNQVGVWTSASQLGTGTIPFTSGAGGYAIGTTTLIDSGLVTFQSVTQGIYIPRMTSAQRNAIGGPQTGLMIYNTTTDTLNLYTSAAAYVGVITTTQMPATYVRGDILYASTTATLSRLAAPAANNYLTSNGVGADVSWTTAPGVDGSFTTVDLKTVTVTKGIITAIAT